MDFLEKLRAEREDHDESQYELAKALGIQKPHADKTVDLDSGSQRTE